MTVVLTVSVPPSAGESVALTQSAERDAITVIQPGESKLITLHSGNAVTGIAVMPTATTREGVPAPGAALRSRNRPELDRDGGPEQPALDARGNPIPPRRDGRDPLGRDDAATEGQPTGYNGNPIAITDPAHPDYVPRTELAERMSDAKAEARENAGLGDGAELHSGREPDGQLPIFDNPDSPGDAPAIPEDADYPGETVSERRARVAATRDDALQYEGARAQALSGLPADGSNATTYGPVDADTPLDGSGTPLQAPRGPGEATGEQDPNLKAENSPATRNDPNRPLGT